MMKKLSYKRRHVLELFLASVFLFVLVYVVLYTVRLRELDLPQTRKGQGPLESVLNAYSVKSFSKNSTYKSTEGDEGTIGKLIKPPQNDGKNTSKSEVKIDLLKPEVPKPPREHKGSHVFHIGNITVDNSTWVPPREFLSQYNIPSGILDQDPSTLSVYPSENLTSDRIIEQMLLTDHDPDRVLNITYFGTDVPTGRRKFLDDQCPVHQCSISGFSHRDQADVVLFRNSVINLPTWKRPPHQLWVVYLLEAPPNTMLPKKLGVNFTATYRPDSTLVTPYERFTLYANITLPDKPARNYAEGKTKLVAWFVSHCLTNNGREEYTKQLQKHIAVDVYGKCGSHTCSRSSTEECYNMLSQNYKFYLAFENCNCRHYITEKLYWNAYRNNIIPVVMGAPKEDYEAVVPPHSIIHVDDFESPRHLAEYLHYLDRNDTAYNQYFRWKGTGEFIDTKFWCRLCAMAHYAQTNPVWNEDTWYWFNHNICIGQDSKKGYSTWRTS